MYQFPVNMMLHRVLCILRDRSFTVSWGAGTFKEVITNGLVLHGGGGRGVSFFEDA